MNTFYRIEILLSTIFYVMRLRNEEFLCVRVAFGQLHWLFHKVKTLKLQVKNLNCNCLKFLTVNNQ